MRQFHLIVRFCIHTRRVGKFPGETFQRNYYCSVVDTGSVAFSRVRTIPVSMVAAGDTAEEFTFSSFIRGYHVYQRQWTPTIGEELTCTIEKDNVEDKFAVSVTKNDQIVGHISKVCHLSLLPRAFVANDFLRVFHSNHRP